MLSSPTKASAAPPTAVFRQPKRSVNMLTTGEQKKIMPMARAPTQATLNCDVLSSGSACSRTSIRCMMPKEFWMPNMEPLHQVAANTTSQPYPPSGGTNPAPCAVSPWTLTSGSEAGGRGGLHPTSTPGSPPVPPQPGHEASPRGSATVIQDKSRRKEARREINLVLVETEPRRSPATLWKRSGQGQETWQTI